MKDNTGWKEGLGSLRFQEAIKDPNKVREHEARTILGNTLFDAYVNAMYVEWHHNEVGQVEYFLTRDDIERAKRNAAFYIQIYERANRKKEGKAFVIPASEYDSDLYECLARGYLTKSGKFVKSDSLFKQTHVKVKRYKA